ncbi:MAG: hypothetical protein JXD19_07735 [Deltaproteobacteria bacterium]|nr:hypothetical protein [Deltaproteobacteria bacterium]
MVDKITAIEREIQKIEDRIRKLKKADPQSERDKAVRETTLALLVGVRNDLRHQQERIRQKINDPASR